MNRQVLFQQKEDPTSVLDDKIPSTEIYQCANCLKIIGDSSSTALSNQEQRWVALHDYPTSNNEPLIVTVRQAETSMSGQDAGCTYYPLRCSNCGQTLGKKYLTTTNDFDLIRNRLTINLDHISVYRCTPPIRTSLSPNATPSTDEHRISSIELDIVKLKDFCVVINERLEKVELFMNELLQQILDIANARD
ncbi:uncharacterized protein LOC126324042 isoform X1 [Schistocerca gregaria]|uniref:uncharacterized protein LOC126324042 isoform X1 n=1 Tax=Schistocerca gregaria TaxID=7010 RepID=UPI00211EDE43|nr:uncharacterized protein LOC126324042 isoform X1 [Schistocerca gregaria]